MILEVNSNQNNQDQYKLDSPDSRNGRNQSQFKNNQDIIHLDATQEQRLLLSPANSMLDFDAEYKSCISHTNWFDDPLMEKLSQFNEYEYKQESKEINEESMRKQSDQIKEDQQNIQIKKDCIEQNVIEDQSNLKKIDTINRDDKQSQLHIKILQENIQTQQHNSSIFQFSQDYYLSESYADYHSCVDQSRFMEDDMIAQDIQTILQYEEEGETSSELICELHRNEQKLTQPIYFQKQKIKQITKPLQDTLIEIGKTFLKYFSLEDVCNIKKALKYGLCRASIKVIDDFILHNIWTKDEPNSFLLWDSLIGYSYLKALHPTQYQKFAWTENPEQTRNIRLDLDRTFPDRIDFQDNTAGQDKLFRVLNGISRSVKELGYMQGWNQMAGAFLLFGEFSEEMVYWIMNYLMHQVQLKDLYLSIQTEVEKETSKIEIGKAEIHKENEFFSFNSQGVGEHPKHMKTTSCVSNSLCGHDERDNSNHNGSILQAEHGKDEKTKECIQISRQNQIRETIPQLDHNHPMITLDFLHFTVRIFLQTYLNPVFEAIKDVDYQIYTQKWIMVLFSQQLSPEITICFIAGIILEDWNFVLKMILTIFDILSADLIAQTDPDDIIEKLSSVQQDSEIFSKQRIYEGINKFPITTLLMMQLKYLFDEKGQIDNLKLHDGVFKRTTQIKHVAAAIHPPSSNIFERLGSFLFSPTPRPVASFTEEITELKYLELPPGLSVEEGKFSEIIYFEKRTKGGIGQRLKYLYKLQDAPKSPPSHAPLFQLRDDVRSENGTSSVSSYKKQQQSKQQSSFGKEIALKGIR